MTDRFAYPTSLRAGFLAGFQPALHAGRRGQYATVSVAIGGPRLRCAEGGDARLAAIRAFDRAAPPGRSGATGSALAGPARSARSGPPVFAGTSKDGERRSVRTDHWKDTHSQVIRKLSHRQKAPAPPLSLPQGGLRLTLGRLVASALSPTASSTATTPQGSPRELPQQRGRSRCRSSAEARRALRRQDVPCGTADRWSWR